MSRTTRRAAAAFSLISLGMGAPLSAEAAGTCTAEATHGPEGSQPHRRLGQGGRSGRSLPCACIVEGAIATGGDGAGPNSARLRVQLPQKWNGKLVFFGVGGLAGSLDPSANLHDVASAFGRGYATAITDTGHVGKNPFDAELDTRGPGQAERGEDHRLFLPRAASGDGRRQGDRGRVLRRRESIARLFRRMLVRRPHGAHGGDALPRRLRRNHRRRALHGQSHAALGLQERESLPQGACVAKDVVAKVNEAVLAQCDASDGVKDGLIQNPGKCSFDPQSLVPATLTPGAGRRLQDVHGPVTDAAGHAIYPGSPVTDLAAADGPGGGFVGWVVTPDAAGRSCRGRTLGGRSANPVGRGRGLHEIHRPSRSGLRLQQQLAREGRSRSRTTRSSNSTRGSGSATPTSRSGSRRSSPHGKKLILFHGYGDTAISPFRTVWFYEDLAKGLGGYDKAREHARLFMVPGMLHCFGGDGPSGFDTLSALDAWVEEGKAPDGIAAAKFPDNKPGEKALRTMPLCAFPEQARYKGTGEVNGAENWACVNGDTSSSRSGRRA